MINAKRVAKMMDPGCLIIWRYGLYLLLVCLSTSDAGISVTSSISICLTGQSYIVIQCPAEHRVAVTSARYYRSRASGCSRTTADPDVLGDETLMCMAQNVVADVYFDCYKMIPCNVSVTTLYTEDTACNDTYVGDVFFRVTYKCEPDMGKGTHSLDMCNTVDNWQGSYLFILSPEFPGFANIRHCGCSFTVHESLDLDVKVPNFEYGVKKEGKVLKEHPCSQSLTFWTEYGREKICSEDKDSHKELDFKKGMNFHVLYENPLNLTVRYWIILQVHHAFNFNVSCSHNFHIPAPTTLSPHSPSPPTGKTTTLPQRTTTTTTNPPSEPSTKTTLAASTTPRSGYNKSPVGGDQDGSSIDIWKLAAGILAALLVTVLIIIGLVVYCRRKRKRSQSNKRVEELNNAFDNTIYMSPGEVLRTGSNGTSYQYQTLSDGDLQAQAQEQNVAQRANTRTTAVSLSSLPSKPGLENNAFEPEPRSSGDPYKEYLEKEAVGGVHTDTNVQVQERSERLLSVRDKAKLMQQHWGHM